MKAAECQLDEFNAHELANMAWAFVMVGLQDRKLFRALAVAANEVVEHWWLREALLWQECLGCSAAAIIVVTDQGRVLYQNRREGRQGFGGGRILHGLLLKCTSARRELLDESGLHYTNIACKYLSPVQLVTQATIS